ncbi:DEAD/DEAH box helicase [Cellulomonas fimi]|uniref:DEAD/DEAH box helicase n=1 Tax=Cellulomonas fimi TaxID=1708 RepID=A0A7Y0LYG5_CELFI|nr:DEAD/DEAH box helicase [Cellulomonas fimi]NMR20226.1 DEAD/DEAH box helicase [Cellulomonas fimi]
MQLAIEDGEIRRVVGGGAYARGADYARGGRVLTRRWDGGASTLSGTVRGSGRSTYSTTVAMKPTATGTMRVVDSSCTCPVGSSCKHAAALLLQTRSDAAGGVLLDGGPTAPPASPGPRGSSPGTVTPRQRAGRRASPAAPPVPAWQRLLDAALHQEQPPPSRGQPLALQLELMALPARPGRGASERFRLAARPVVRGARGRWVRTGISWADVVHGYAYRFDARPVAALGALHSLAASGHGGTYRYYGGDVSVYLDDIGGRALWQALDDLRDAGVPLVHARHDEAPVTLLAAPARALVDLRADGDAIVVAPGVLVDGEVRRTADGHVAGQVAGPVTGQADGHAGGEPIDPNRLHLIGGREPTGAYWWSAADDAEPVPKNRTLTLARFAEPLAAEAAALLRAGQVLRVPAAQADRFWREYYPRLAARMRVDTRDGSVELPAPPRAVLQLVVRAGEEHTVDLEWEWEYRADDGTATHTVPLRRVPGEQSWRSPDDEARILAAVVATLDHTVPDAAAAAPTSSGTGVLESLLTAVPAAPGGPVQLAERCRLGPWQTVELVGSVLPALRALPDVDVVVVGDLADYRQAEHEPRIEVDAAPSAPSPGVPGAAPGATAGLAAPGADRDWFDLQIDVRVGDREVPLAPLLRALTLGEDRLLLADGLWLRIDTPALESLRTLVQEARALQDAPRGQLRISRLQAGAWGELEALGVVLGQARAWREVIADLRRLEALPDDVPVPPSVRADLRPYQRAGFEWLSRLWTGGLGGILADDMGLGKTLQVLALAARLRLDAGAVLPEGAERPDDVASDGHAVTAAAPLLVVAPTSVVGNWAVEAARFVPDLRVRTIERTRAKRGTDLADVAAGADVVVTSYALFRLEFDDYAALPWSVLVLDEAQMVKNHESRTYACARQLGARVKVAITGTPLENTVMELWALLGLVAPGLFPSSQRFTELYRTPIEREGDAERLALLRRRIRPWVLRRTKEQVAADLPPRIEQVVEVELAARHRAVYDRHLHRERQKVLGLLDDLDGNRFEIFRSLMLLRRLSLDPSLVDAAHAGVPATKLDVLDDMLREIVADGHRVLVFSQFTGVLARVRTRLEARGVEHSYLDGTTRRRAAVIERFRTGEAPVFLISLKAGGFGLTLTEADYVVVLDPWWNPAVEAQAVDRVHRIGQRRTVVVYRLVATGTIEEKVMALKEGKSALFDSVLGGGELADSRLSATEIRALLE